MFDVHFHPRAYLAATKKLQDDNPLLSNDPLLALPANYLGCASLHDRADWQTWQVLSGSYPGICAGFGRHPQQVDPAKPNEDDEGLSFIETLAGQGLLQAVGECGYDFFDGRTHELEEAQDRVFLSQVARAIRFGLPLVVHLRKATDLMFRHVRVLKRCKAVVFHSWPGPVNEARSLLEQGVNAYFSFGTPLLWNARKACACVAALPLERLVAETDAPWQPVRGKEITGPLDLVAVYQKLASLRGLPVQTLVPVLYQNAINALSMSDLLLKIG